jgi:hypothetical protein
MKASHVVAGQEPQFVPANPGEKDSCSSRNSAIAIMLPILEPTAAGCAACYRHGFEELLTE